MHPSASATAVRRRRSAALEAGQILVRQLGRDHYLQEAEEHHSKTADPEAGQENRRERQRPVGIVVEQWEVGIGEQRVEWYGEDRWGRFVRPDQGHGTLCNRSWLVDVDVDSQILRWKLGGKAFENIANGFDMNDQKDFTIKYDVCGICVI